MRYMWIPWDIWYAWSNEERADMQKYWEQCGVRMVLDASSCSMGRKLRDEHQKDRDEYINEMSIGGRLYRENY